MNSLSYKEIEKVVENIKTLPKDTPVPVQAGALRGLFKSIKSAMRCQGILGFTDEGHPVVNDIGMVAIVKSVAKEEYESLGIMVSCQVSRKAGDLIWSADMVFAAPNGTSITLTQRYRLSYLSDKRKFQYELP